MVSAMILEFRLGYVELDSKSSKFRLRYVVNRKDLRLDYSHYFRKPARSGKREVEPHATEDGETFTTSHNPHDSNTYKNSNLPIQTSFTASHNPQDSIHKYSNPPVQSRSTRVSHYQEISKQREHHFISQESAVEHIFMPNVKPAPPDLTDLNSYEKPPSIVSLRKKFPRIMIIGFGKTGTRALYDALKMHPYLQGPNKEKRFFSEHYSSGLWNYLTSLPFPLEGERVMEKSPDYIINKSVPTRIKESVVGLNISVVDLKFIVMLRDPIDRAMSEYLEWEQARHRKGSKLLPFRAMVLRDNGTVNDDNQLIDNSNYVKYILRWFKHFNKNQTCFVDGDNFIADPLFEMLQVEKCLGIQPYFTPDNFIYDSNKQFFCFKKSKAQKEALCMNSSKGRRHPKIPKEVFRKLCKYYQFVNGQLDSVTGRQMKWIKKCERLQT